MLEHDDRQPTARPPFDISRAEKPTGGRPSAFPLPAQFTAALLDAAKPVIDGLAAVILVVTVAFLQPAFELFAPPVDGGEVIIGELAPLLFGLAGELLPVALNRIPVHLISPW